MSGNSTLSAPLSAINKMSGLNIILALASFLSVFILRIIESTRDTGLILNKVVEHSSFNYRNKLLFTSYH